MRNIVLKHDLGIVAEDFNLKKFAKRLSQISIDSINKYKQNTNKVAYNLSTDFYNERVLNEIEMLFLNSIWTLSAINYKWIWYEKIIIDIPYFYFIFY